MPQSSANFLSTHSVSRSFNNGRDLNLVVLYERMLTAKFRHLIEEIVGLEGSSEKFRPNDADGHSE